MGHTLLFGDPGTACTSTKVSLSVSGTGNGVTCLSIDAFVSMITYLVRDVLLLFFCHFLGTECPVLPEPPAESGLSYVPQSSLSHLELMSGT